MEKREWRQIAFDGIVFSEKISSDGMIMKKDGTIVDFSTRKPTHNRYYAIDIHEDSTGDITREYVHKLVAIMFIPNPNGHKHVHHINHNHLDNRVENLEWIDIREHGMESTKHQGGYIGEERALGICKAIAAGKTTAEICKEFGVEDYIVYPILNKQTYTHISKPYWEDFKNSPIKQRNHSLYKNKVDEMIRAGKTYTDITTFLMVKHGLKLNEAESYYYNRRRRLLGKTPGTTSDGRYKYTAIIPDLYKMLLDKVDRKVIKEWLIKEHGLSKDQAKDLIRQRIRALLENRADEYVDYNDPQVKDNIKAIEEQYNERLERARKAKMTRESKA